MNDTSPFMEKKMREMVMAKTPFERLVMGSSMYETSRYLIERSILENDPLISKEKLREEIFLKFYKNDFSAEECAKILKHLRANSENNII